MSTSGSDLTLTTVNGETTESLLACLSEIIESISGIESEQAKFLEIASYLYRVTPIFKLLERSRDNSSNTMGIQESLYRRIRLAKDILDGVQENGGSITSSDTQMILKHMDGTIRFIGECLGSAPPSAFEDHGYAEIAVKSLSDEMKKARFVDTSSEEDEQAVFDRFVDDQTETNVSENTTTTEVDRCSVQVEASQSFSYLSEDYARTGQGLALYAEPPYGGFICPLSKKIMQEPVTIESGATFERSEIDQWFQRHDDLEEVICPVTGQKIASKVMFPSLALTAIIQEWHERNETGKIKVIYAALSLSSSDSMILEALKDLKTICQRRSHRISEVLSNGIAPLIVKLLEYKDSMIRCAALETLLILAEDPQGKETIGTTMAVTSIVRMMSSRYQPVKHAALLLLVELSSSLTLSEKIGRVTGGVLMLIRASYERSTDAFAAEAATTILKNLARSPHNVKRMAENGFLEPLLDNLVEGSDNMKAEMASYLAEVVLGHDNNSSIVKKASPTLVKMAQSENASLKKAAFTALVPISSLHQNANTLVESGLTQVLGEEIFARNAHFEATDTLKAATEILANLLESDLDLRDTAVTSQGHTMMSDYVTSSVLNMLTSSSFDGICLGLIRIVSCLMKWSTSSILSAIRDSEVCDCLAGFVNDPDEKLGIASIKLLVKLAPYMGTVLIEKICQVHGQPQGLVQIPSDLTRITERQVLSVRLLASLPHENLELNLRLSDSAANLVQTVEQIQGTGTRKNRYANGYLEGLVGILVRFTSTLYDPQMLALAVNNDFTALFKNLLTGTLTGETKRLAAIGLEKLSVMSVKLSKPPRVERRSSSMTSFGSPRFLLSRTSGRHKMGVCPIHRGVCSAKNTFCLLVSGAIEALLSCFDNRNVEVVESAVSALSTLLEEGVDTEKSVVIMQEMKVTEQMVKLVRDFTEESLLQKVFWMVEVILRIGGEDFGDVVLKDKKFNSKLVNSFYHGETYTRQIAEKILTHLKIMPGSTITFT